MPATYGILAYPAGHSLSPVMHEVAFRELGIDATYEKFEIPPEQLGEFIQRVRQEKIAGLSVSIPHKVEIVKLLDEIDELATPIGAVNTVSWKDNKLIGSNTDWAGFLTALTEKLSGKENFADLSDVIKTAKKHLEGKEVVVLGGGGAARAIVSVLKSLAGKTTVITREEWESEGVKKDFNVETNLITNLNKYDSDILINATPLGMQGKFEDQSFVPAEYFEKYKSLIFDIVYNPIETKLLREARKAGCETLNGVEMFVWQGVWQLSRWTDDQQIEKVVIDKMREVVLNELRKSS